MSSKRRLFVGIPLDTERQSAISVPVMTVRRELEAGVREAKATAWIPPENYHITLKFLGSTDEDLLPAIHSLLESTAAATAPFELTYTALGTFGGRQPRILWIGVTPQESILRLNARLEEGFEKLGFARETREFHPHLTIAKNLSRGAERLPPFSLPESVARMRVRELALFESVSHASRVGSGLRSGVRYEAVSRFNLRTT